MMQGALDTRPAPKETRAEALRQRRKRSMRVQIDAQLLRYQLDPALYAAEVLKQQWWARQVEIAHAVRTRRRVAVFAGHSVGKTHLMGGLVQWFYDCFDPSITLTTAPNWSSIHDLLWGEIKKQRPANANGRLLDLRLDGGPMHYAAGHNAESSSGFQGRHEAKMLIVLDEAMGVPSYIWEATNAMLTSPDCRVVALGNPTETSGEYYDAYDDPDWHRISISCLEHPNLIAELAGLPPPYPAAVTLVWVEEMVRKHATRTDSPDAECFEWPPGSGVWYKPDDVFRSRVLGVFPKQSAQAIWSEEWLALARKRELTWKPKERPQIGADIARYGDDLTTLYSRRGPVVLGRDSYAKQGTMETVGRILKLREQLAGEHECPLDEILVKIDDTGLGGGVTDRCRELGVSVRPIDFGGIAHDPNEYFNRGAEMWFEVAERARVGQLDLTRLDAAVFRQLSAELRARQYKIQSDKTLRIEGKDDIRKRLRRSPDDADGLVLSFAEDFGVQVIDLEAPMPKRDDEPERKVLGAFDQQLQRVAPYVYEEQQSADLTCGQCLYRSLKNRGAGKHPWCEARGLFIRDTDPACDGLFELKL